MEDEERGVSSVKSILLLERKLQNESANCSWRGGKGD